MKISLLFLFIISTATHAEKLTQRQYNETIFNMMNELKETQTQKEKALGSDDKKEFSKQQCKLLNILEDIVNVSSDNKNLENGYSFKVTGEERLRYETALMKKGNVDKEMVCNYMYL